MNAMRSTSLIFVWSIPILVCIGLLSLFNYNKFIGFWFLSPYDYPFSFAIALFISLTASAIGVWIFREQCQDFNLFIVILCIFLGCLSRLSVAQSLEVNIFYMFIVLPFALIFLGKIAISIADLLTLLVGGIRLIWGSIAFYILPLLFVLLICKFPSQKPPNQAKRFRYASPALGAIMLIYFYTFGTSFYVTPGLIIPNN